MSDSETKPVDRTRPDEVAMLRTNLSAAKEQLADAVCKIQYACDQMETARCALIQFLMRDLE